MRVVRLSLTAFWVEVMSQVVARHAARLLLLAVLALGVAGMHTLGHPHGGNATAMRGPTPVEAWSHHAAALTSLPAADGLIATDAPVPPMDPMNVCLAILTAVGIAITVLALLSISTRARRTTLPHGPVWTVSARGPPTCVPPLGRRLAALSVLRT